MLEFRIFIHINFAAFSVDKEISSEKLLEFSLLGYLSNRKSYARKDDFMKRRLLMLIVLSGILLSGCNNASTSNDVSGDGEGTLVYGRGTDSISLDPSRETDGESFKVARNIYETLVKFGEKDTSIEPSLAKSWEISNDGTTYTFTLHEGIKFHDGTDFNAGVVVKNFERWMNSSAADFPYYGDMFGGFANDESHIIERISAPDATTFIVELKNPSAPILNNLAMVAFSIASPTVFEADPNALATKPVGTGPFIFKEWRRNDAIYLEKNPDYWREGYPKVAQVIYKTLPDNSARINSLVAGEIDIADGLSPNDGSRLESEAKAQLYERPSFNIGFLGMTLTQEPFGDVKIREAVSYAIDRESIVASYFEGRGEVAKNPMQPNALGYNQDTAPYVYDPAKAKQLLADSSYDGAEIELWTMPIPRPYMPDGAKVAEVIQKNLEDIGMKTKVITYEWPTYLEKTTNGEAQFFILGGTSDNGDPDNLLSLFFDKQGSLNKTRLDDKDIQGWLKEARETTDEALRIELYEKIQQRLREVMLLIPIVHATPILGVGERVENYIPHPTESDDLSGVTVQ